MKGATITNQVSTEKENQISINVSIGKEVIELPNCFELGKFDNIFKLSFKGEQLISFKEITSEKFKNIIYSSYLPF